MNRKALLVSVILFTLVGAAAPFTDAFKRIKETLTGYEEVPSISTRATGVFSGRIDNQESKLDWTLSYSDLEGAVQQSHIHFGNKGVNGGITVFLCTNLGNGPAGTQPCPAPPATISGTITAADISPDIPATAAARTQGLETGEFDEFLEAVRAGSTYVNIHSTRWPGGEVRSQISGHQGNHTGSEGH